VIDLSRSALKELLNQVIDYAGLFPPANLSLAEALHTFRRHRAEPTAWIVARLVAPIDALTQLTAADSATLGPFRISLIPGRVTTSADFTAALQSDLDRAHTFLDWNNQEWKGQGLGFRSYWPVSVSAVTREHWLLAGFAVLRTTAHSLPTRGPESEP
jgi:hypothetical protein